LNDPRMEYAHRLEFHRRTAGRIERQHIRAGNAKLAVLAAGVIMIWLSAVSHLFSIAWMLAPVAIFAALVVWHENVLQALGRAKAAENYYVRGFARIEDRWAGTGQTGERFRDDKHTYSEDLDLFGKGCLFELLSTARLPMGEKRLAEWLRSPSPLDVIRERQNIVAQLRENCDLRESIAVMGEAVRARLDPESLTSWAERAAAMPEPIWRWLAAFLTVATAATLVYGLIKLSFEPLLAVLLLEGFVWRWLHQKARTVIDSLNCNAEGVSLFLRILDRIEKETYESPRLQGFAAELRSEVTPASDAIAGLARIATWIDSCHGLFARLLDVPALYTIQVGFAAEAWRSKFGKSLHGWIEITGEMEALLSLSAYAFEHPADPFPEFETPSAAATIFDGKDLGHPLIPISKCVTNHVRLDGETRVLLVSGSNMSGKSTLLRTVGINAVLAMAGAPIRGKSLRLSPLFLGTRIHSTDSLLEGRSNFYTEILRIRRVFEWTEREWPLLFLFDELLEGTNSNDRRIGAEGLLQALLGRRAIGIVTTHDLALTEITQSLGPRVRNVHFQDYVENGEMRFDYKLREGVVAHSNALELMRLIGLRI
jgi:hypothetical protein